MHEIPAPDNYIDQHRSETKIQMQTHLRKSSLNEDSVEKRNSIDMTEPPSTARNTIPATGKRRSSIGSNISGGANQLPSEGRQAEDRFMMGTQTCFAPERAVSQAIAQRTRIASPMVPLAVKF
jgi:hypothetical protein